jgi:pimeloyl-ACP methyl ester carboxylesterase
MVDYKREIHHSAIMPQCTYAIYRIATGCAEGTVLYYFHGSGGDEGTWLQANGGIIEAWKARAIKPPIVIAVTFGREWLLFPGEASANAVHLEEFVNDLIPEIEARIGGHIVRRRVFGFSIGGQSAAQLFFRYPELFDAAVLASPEIYTFPIYAPDAQIDAFASSLPHHGLGIRTWIKRNVLKLSSAKINPMIYSELSLIKSYLVDHNSWAMADILSNMRPIPPGKKARVYISCARLDGYGFFPGASELAKLAAEQGYKVDFEALAGNHMTLDQPRIAAFLAGSAP